ncbi:diphthine--ammonia ligase [Candidatus Bathyarchaeota archaeon]|nr:diphthine--ammonia ligase [Candidatus Bathyarchaeota archaeon]
MKAAALFSGGKDSLFALYIAEKQGAIVKDLITLLPTLPWPSPHAKNIEALKILAKSMKKKLTIVDFSKENALPDVLRKLEIDTLIAGDINVEAHLLGLEDLCNKVGLNLAEPLYGKDTSKLFIEIFNSGFKALISGVNLKFLEEKWLGFIISEESSTKFLSKIGNIDPLGENGEFHTLVLDCPLYSNPFKVISLKKKVVKNIAYLIASIS